MLLVRDTIMQPSLIRDRRGGVDFVELLIVVALVGFVGVVGVDMLQESTRQKVEQEAGWVADLHGSPGSPSPEASALPAPPSATDDWGGRFVHVAAQPAPPESLADQVARLSDGRVALAGGEISAVLEPGASLYDHWALSVDVPPETRIGARISGDGIDVRGYPLAVVDLPWPAENVIVHGVHIDPATGHVAVNASSDRTGWGVVDLTQMVERQASARITDAIAGRPLDLLRDPAALDALASDGDGAAPRVPLDGVRSPAATVTVTPTEDYVRELETGAIRVSAGHPISVSITAQGSAAELLRGMDADSMAEKLAGVRVDRVTIAGDGIDFLVDGEPVLGIEEVTIHRGGAVQITRSRPKGPAAAAVGLEALVRIVAVATRVYVGGVRPGDLSGDSSVPTLVPALIADKLREAERLATERLRVLIRAEGDTLVPGVDLGRVLGIERAPADAPL